MIAISSPRPTALPMIYTLANAHKHCQCVLVGGKPHRARSINGVRQLTWCHLHPDAPEVDLTTSSTVAA